MVRSERLPLYLPRMSRLARTLVDFAVFALPLDLTFDPVRVTGRTPLNCVVS